MRDYGTEGIVWDGDPECPHNFLDDGTYHDNQGFRAGENTTVGNNLNPEIYTHFLHRGTTKSKVQNRRIDKAKSKKDYRKELGIEY